MKKGSLSDDWYQARFVDGRSGMNCANQSCRRKPLDEGEGGWLYLGGSGNHWCPLCAQKYGLRDHHTGSRIIEDLRDGT